MSYVLCLALFGLPSVNVDLFTLYQILKLICSVELFLTKNLFYRIAV
jgi:hypothetical protein